MPRINAVEIACIFSTRMWIGETNRGPGRFLKSFLSGLCYRQSFKREAVQWLLGACSDIRQCSSEER